MRVTTALGNAMDKHLKHMQAVLRHKMSGIVKKQQEAICMLQSKMEKQLLTLQAASDANSHRITKFGERLVVAENAGQTNGRTLSILNLATQKGFAEIKAELKTLRAKVAELRAATDRQFVDVRKESQLIERRNERM
jgi:hypothetical protein